MSGTSPAIRIDEGLPEIGENTAFSHVDDASFHGALDDHEAGDEHGDREPEECNITQGGPLVRQPEELAR